MNVMYAMVQCTDDYKTPDFEVDTTNKSVTHIVPATKLVAPLPLK